MRYLERTLHKRNGVALVVTLVLIGFLVICLLGLLVAAGGGRRRSFSDRDYARTRLLTDIAAQEAMAKIVTGFEEISTSSGERRGNVTASPGLMEIRYYDTAPNRGTERGSVAFTNNPTRPSFFRNPFFATYSGRPANPRWIPLFSWKWFAPAVPNLKIQSGRVSEPNPDFNPAAVFDINTTKNPFHPGHHYLTGVPATPVALRYEKDGHERFASTDNEAAFTFLPGEVAPDRPVYVQWIPVLRDQAEKPSKDNPMVGRYAYWVDVENTKVNLTTSTRPLRQSDFFPLLNGDSDAEAGSGRDYFEQSERNPYRRGLQALEGALPRKAQGTSGTYTANGQPGPGSNMPGRYLRDLLLGWQNGERPFAADNSVVDWDYFNGLRPSAHGRGEKIAFDDLIGKFARTLETNPDLTFNSWEEIFSLLDPALQERDPAQARLVRDSLRRTLAPSTTIYGYEEERDPLGNPKLDLVKFLQNANRYAGRNGSPAGLRSTPLWNRLTDSAYHRAYYPAAYPSGGAARSFVSAYNRFAGTGNANDDANGEVAVQQMLLNILEYTLPDSVPPHLDPITGLVGMRSMPYVAEVATRARSALWLLPESVRSNPGELSAPGFKYNGKPLSWYLSHVVIDLAIGLVNPDPFSNRSFRGTLWLDYSWHSPPPDSDLIAGPQSAPINGRYTALPLPGDKAGKVRVDGEAIYFQLGVVPGSALKDRNYAQTLRIRGWEIRDEKGVPWHAVPIRHPRAASVAQWWQMAEQGANAGSVGDLQSLSRYQENSAQYGYRAVGWFSGPTLEAAPLNRLFVSNPNASSNSVSLKDVVVERVFSRDPALGHRTGNRGLTGVFGRDSSHQKGHFYGLLGHTWRHVESKQPGVLSEDEEDDGDGEPAKKTYALKAAEYISDGIYSLSANTKIPKGATYTTGLARLSLPVARADNLKVLTAEVWSSQSDSLTAFFSDPKWERFPLWELDGASSSDEAEEPVKDIDVETTAKLLTVAGVKTKDLRAGARGFFAGAPRGDVMTSLGELGFCHSGFVNFPIVLTGSIGWNEYQLNSPRNGPPMRMVLDLFTPGAFTDPETRRPVSENSWRTGRYTSNSPATPRRGTWNLNTSIAHDSYMVIREGDNDQAELKKEIDPSKMAARVAWIPSAAGAHRTERGAEYYRGKKLEDIEKKQVIGSPLDRYSNPSSTLNRGAPAWVTLLGGDFSPGRVTGGARWGFNNSGATFFGPAQFTWRPGNGVVPFGSTEPFADFAGNLEMNARLLTFGSDGRKEGGEDKKPTDDKEGFLRGRFAADQNLIAAQVNSQVSLPLAMAPRFSLVPMRHFVSDLAEEFTFGASFVDFKTPLNPRQSAYPPGPDLKRGDGAGFPGSHHASGIFANAPIALLANQVSTSANVFTIHVVAQAVNDTGTRRNDSPKSGFGYSDPDDQVLAESWARIVFAKLPPQSPGDTTNRFQILSYETRPGTQ